LRDANVLLRGLELTTEEGPMLSRYRVGDRVKAFTAGGDVEGEVVDVEFGICAVRTSTAVVMWVSDRFVVGLG
jgi:hypothetical protein